MRNPFSIEEKYIIVTGASSGIGAVTARVLSEQGARIILVGRDKNRLNESLMGMENSTSHLIEEFDLSEIDAIPDWIKTVTNKIGTPIHGLAHFAGIHKTIPLRVLNKKNIEQIMDINVYSSLSLLKAATNKNLFSQGSSIVLASSVMGQVGQAGVVSYSASKGAINAIVKSAAIELARFNIRVNAVVPGMVKTVMFDELLNTIPSEQHEKTLSYHPLGFGEPKDVAYAAQYLLSDAAKWVTGTTLVVDGGYTCH